MSMSKRLSAIVLVVCALALWAERVPDAQATRTAAPHLTTPLEEWGHSIGDDYFLADYRQLTAYWKKLEKQSPRLKLVDIGKSSEGRTMLMAIITSPANHQKLAQYKSISARLANAEGLTDD